MRGILGRKMAAVWGVGYLGYTTAIRLQAQGFHILLHDFSPQNMEALSSGDYPSSGVKEVWSRSLDVPGLDRSRLTLAADPRELFAARVHFIGFAPEMAGYEELLEVFTANPEACRDALVVFLAAETPGSVQRNFIAPLRAAGAACAVAAAFRHDWTIEEFLTSGGEQILAADSPDSLAKAAEFYGFIGQRHTTLASIQEAEIFENARRSLDYAVCAFVNQLALSYPGADIRKLSRHLVAGLSQQEVTLGMGLYEFKIESAIRHFLKGADRPEHLSLVREAQRTGLTMLLHYGDLLKKRRVRNVAILGLSARADMKDIRFASSLILAEYLNRQGVGVAVHDPFFSAEEITRIMPFARPLELAAGTLKADAVVLMTNHSRYRCLGQEDLDALGLTRAGVVIDNVGLFERFAFSRQTMYHLVGDGRLPLLE